MALIPKLHEFAVAWCERLESPDFQWSELRPSDITLENIGFPCQSNYAEQFRADYGPAAQDSHALSAVLDDINNVFELVAVLYERWQEIWQCPSGHLPSEEDQAWFHLIFRRLALLTGKNQYPFAGSPQMLRLTSCAGCFFSVPAPNREVKQTLSIDTNGSVTFTGYAYADLKRPCRRIHFSIGKGTVQRIFATAVHYCNECFDPSQIIFDAGGWDMRLSSKEGGQYLFSGYLWGEPGSAEFDFSELLRTCLSMCDLFGIDGNAHSYSKLDRITLRYAETYFVPHEYSHKDDVPEYSEESACLVVDRDSRTVETTLVKSDGSRTVLRYEHPDYVPDLLDAVSNPVFFRVNDTAVDDVVEPQIPNRTYELLLEREDGTKTTLSGRYDQFGLPSLFPAFIKKAAHCLRAFDSSLFSQNVYQRVPRRKTDLIYCSVEFWDGGSKTYYYRTDDDSLEAGDDVVVPVGKDNHPAIAEIVDVEYFSPDSVPFPIEKTKVILRRCSEDDYNEIG